ncbi:MAG: GntR family transcriptional regulator [Alicyclobacillus macrosporangiidus]|uniref:GntR family transcriptional regulator n=1 Tax=Alicyclobacillus macrosporangiidus TaxID=392015 RepID=UPI0026EF2D19|nr:GntR family transcriptional regulator [Alicyclobacillus macrosporangiidus]MCL6599946.1 GntR family transcriptional regulator [Alicyclobacillus macrosporangiidus]
MSDTPKYLQLVEDIKSWIESGKLAPGDKIPTEYELAKQYNISRHTVRQAITQLSYERWVKKAQGRGTFVLDPPSRSNIQSPKSYLIGVITTYVSDYIFPSIIHGIESRLRSEGYSILLASTMNDPVLESQALQSVIDRKVDGVIIEPAMSAYPDSNHKAYLALFERRIPFVMLHAARPEYPVPCVRVDDEAGTKLITEHVMALGHTRIGGIFKADDLQGKLRLRGYLGALREGNVEVKPEYLSFYTTAQREKAVNEYVDGLLKLHGESRPTAIVCYNDDIAFQLIQLLEQQGVRCPDDVSVVGFDNARMPTLGSYQLTTIRHPGSVLGEAAADTILRFIENVDKGCWSTLGDRIFEPQLIVGNSTKEQRVVDVSD